MSGVRYADLIEVLASTDDSEKLSRLLNQLCEDWNVKPSYMDFTRTDEYPVLDFVSTIHRLAKRARRDLPSDLSAI